MNPMNCIILSIGDELVLGQTIDTNSAWLSQQLAAVGCTVLEHITVPDYQDAIERAIRDGVGRCDFLIVTGGIGPTADDLTRQALAEVMNVGLELNETWLEKLKEFFRARGREMPEMNKIQAMIPRGARMIENTCGTAAGIDADVSCFVALMSSIRPQAGEEYMERMFEEQPRRISKFREILEENWTERGRRLSTRVFVMPGVPKEMKAMFTRDVLPHIQSREPGAVILSRTLHTFGLGESAIAEMLDELMKRDQNPSVGTTVSQGIVSLRINSRFETKELAQRVLDLTEKRCRDALGDLIYGSDDETLPLVISRMLRERGLTITTAESCTGGLLAKMLTDIPGSSNYFRQGWVTYSNEAKQSLLGVPPALLAENGAVSEPVVQAMAQSARDRGHADYALAISGIAGPDGGTPSKPVGTVCIGLACCKSSAARTFHLFGDREMIRDRSAKMALTMLRFQLLGKSLPF